MTLRRAAAVRASVLLSFALFGIFLSAQAPSPSQPGGGRRVPGSVQARAARDGRVRVIVELDLPSGRHVPKGQLRNAAAVIGAAARHRARRRLRVLGRAALGRSPRDACIRDRSVRRARSRTCGARRTRGGVVRRRARLRRRARQTRPGRKRPADSGRSGLGRRIRRHPERLSRSSTPAWTRRIRFSPDKVVDEACFSSTVAGSDADDVSRRNRSSRLARARPSRACSISASTARTSRALRRATARRRASLLRRGEGRADHGRAGVHGDHRSGDLRRSARRVSARSRRTSSRDSSRCTQRRAALNVVSVNMSLGGCQLQRAVRRAALQACDRQPAIDRRRNGDRGRQRRIRPRSRRRAASRRRSASDPWTRPTRSRPSRTSPRSCRCSRRADRSTPPSPAADSGC